MYLKFNKKSFNKLILIISLLSFIFLWDLQKNLIISFDFRILIFLYLPYLLFDLLKRNNFAISFIIILLIHYFFVTKAYNQTLIYKDISLILLIYYFLIFSIKKNKEIFEVLPVVVRVFFILFFLMTIFNISKIELSGNNSIAGACAFFIDISSFSSIKFFSENSHFGMIAPASIIYFFFSIKKKNYKKDIAIYLPIIILLIFVYTSATLIIGFIFSCITLLIIYQKEFKYHYLGIFLILSIVLSILFYKEECMTRVTRINYLDYAKLSASKRNNDKLLMKINNDEKIYNTARNITVEVYENAIFVASKTLVYENFGFGFNNYKNAFDKYTNINYQLSKNYSDLINKNNKNLTYVSNEFSENFGPDIRYLNRSDGRSNLIKIISEYGVLSIFIFLFFLFYAFNKKAVFSHKTFLLPLILTQLISGAGYFNGGFILAICLALSLNRKTKLLQLFNK